MSLGGRCAWRLPLLIEKLLQYQMHNSTCDSFELCDEEVRFPAVRLDI